MFLAIHYAPKFSTLKFEKGRNMFLLKVRISVIIFYKIILAVTLCHIVINIFENGSLENIAISI